MIGTAAGPPSSCLPGSPSRRRGKTTCAGPGWRLRLRGKGHSWGNNHYVLGKIVTNQIRAEHQTRPQETFEKLHARSVPSVPCRPTVPSFPFPFIFLYSPNPRRGGSRARKNCSERPRRRRASGRLTERSPSWAQCAPGSGGRSPLPVCYPAPDQYCSQLSLSLATPPQDRGVFLARTEQGPAAPRAREGPRGAAFSRETV